MHIDRYIGSKTTYLNYMITSRMTSSTYKKRHIHVRNDIFVVYHLVIRSWILDLRYIKGMHHVPYPTEWEYPDEVMEVKPSLMY